ncbi:hypothetical protein Tsubulata_010146 [Turnera subulata]|uniref:Uncharacterized protein n=1 Tax=Turnera subulata TaxID=218843 RepID=A0A9Q0G750_9ROSI|nr:hypothetical protein Tsubulata_010146 [Turnera subulata]
MLLFAEVGLGLIGFGIFFSFLGVLLFFDRGLLALGNILWLGGVAILLGWRATWNLFTNRANYKVLKGSSYSQSFLIVTMLLYFPYSCVRWMVKNFILIAILPGGFWPSVKVVLYQIPVVGWIIQYPVMVSISVLFCVLKLLCLQPCLHGDFCLAMHYSSLKFSCVILQTSPL